MNKLTLVTFSLIVSLHVPHPLRALDPTTHASLHKAGIFAGLVLFTAGINEARIGGIHVMQRLHLESIRDEERPLIPRDDQLLEQRNSLKMERGLFVAAAGMTIAYLFYIGTVAAPS